MPEGEESLKNRRNEYSGYIAGKILGTGKKTIRVDFNPTIESETGKGARIDRFNLRMFERPEDTPVMANAVEIGVSMTTEQWQDLIDAMKAELELARETRASLDDLDGH